RARVAAGIRRQGEPAGAIGRRLPSTTVLTVVLVLAVRAAVADPPADIALLHGRIHTQDARRTVVQAMALQGNTIVAVGTDRAISALIGPQTQRIDLRGRTVLPGIIDAHTHPAASAPDLGKCSLHDEMLRAAEVRARAIACLKDNPPAPTQWFEVTHVNPAGLALTRADLDAILSSQPLVLSGSDGHTAWANSAALDAAHVTATTTDPGGGRIERDASGRPTGTLRDNATTLVFAAMPAASL